MGEPWDQLGGLQSQLGGLQSQLGGPQSQMGEPWNQLGGLQNKLGGLQSQPGGPQTKIKNKKTLAAHNLAKISERLLLLMVELKSEDSPLGLITSLPDWL